MLGLARNFRFGIIAINSVYDSSSLGLARNFRFGIIVTDFQFPHAQLGLARNFRFGIITAGGFVGLGGWGLQGIFVLV